MSVSGKKKKKHKKSLFLIPGCIKERIVSDLFTYLFWYMLDTADIYILLVNKVTSLSRIGEGNGNPLQYSCLENPMDRGAW